MENILDSNCGQKRRNVFLMLASIRKEGAGVADALSEQMFVSVFKKQHPIRNLKCKKTVFASSDSLSLMGAPGKKHI